MTDHNCSVLFIHDMENIKNTFRFQFTVAWDIYQDFKKFCNGAGWADGLRALLAIAAKHEEAPFGIYEQKDEE